MSYVPGTLAELADQLAPKHRLTGQQARDARSFDNRYAVAKAMVLKYGVRVFSGHQTGRPRHAAAQVVLRLMKILKDPPAGLTTRTVMVILMRLQGRNAHSPWITGKHLMMLKLLSRAGSAAPGAAPNLPLPTLPPDLVSPTPRPS